MNVFGELEHEFLGSEFDWLAVDRTGALGYFSTAGEGWIPSTVLAAPESFLDSLDLVTDLPSLGVPRNHFTGKHHIADWLNVAERGLFAFDWNRGAKRYELVASPVIPLQANNAGIVGELAEKSLLPCVFAVDFPARGPTEA